MKMHEEIQLELEKEKTKQFVYTQRILEAIKELHPNVQASMVDIIRKLLQKAKII